MVAMSAKHCEGVKEQMEMSELTTYGWRWGDPDEAHTHSTAELGARVCSLIVRDYESRKQSNQGEALRSDKCLLEQAVDIFPTSRGT